MASADDDESTCFVSGLDQDTNENDLRKMFSEFGNIIDSKVIYDHVTGKSRRFGFVTFEEGKSMRDAIKEMNRSSRKNIGFQCFVHGLDCDTNSETLASAFSPFGQVIDSQIINDPETGLSKGYGFVTFKEEKSMRDAIVLMDGDEIDGAQINVEESHRKFVRYFNVEKARPSRLSAATKVAFLLVKLINEKMEKMSGL